MTTTTNKGYTVPTIGGDFNSWGNELNGDLGIIDNNLGGIATVNVAGNSNVTASGPQAQCLIQRLIGHVTGDIEYILPATGGMYVIDNATSGGFGITVITSAGGSTGVLVAGGSRLQVYSNGTDIFVPYTAANVANGFVLVTPLVFQWGNGSTDSSGHALVVLPYGVDPYSFIVCGKDGNMANATAFESGAIAAGVVEVWGSSAVAQTFFWFAVGPA